MLAREESTKRWLLGTERREQATECIREKQVVIMSDRLMWHAIYKEEWVTVGEYRVVVIMVAESTW